MQATAAGMVVGKVWYFDIKLGDFTYGAGVEHGKVKEGDFQPNSPIKVRMEKKAAQSPLAPLCTCRTAKTRKLS